MAKDIKKKFRESLKDLKEYVALATVSAKDYQKTNIEIIKELVEDENIPGVYVTLSKPFETIEKIFKQNKIDTKMVIFIDAVTKTTGGNIERKDNCLFVGSPEKLSDISLAMDQAVMSLPSKERFVFFDSLSVLLMYNEVGTVGRFIHFIASKMRVWKVKGIIISLQKEKNKELIEELMQFCDVTLDLGD
ncbi:MAG: hypothetical protein KAU20_04600 [Nanoarchaeota archaeon]|nr:hypothetical protein [Nanoarchaeota archaeon]